MSDADPDLGPLLRRELGGRKAPAQMRERILRRRVNIWGFVGMAAAVLLALGGLFAIILVPTETPEEIVRLGDYHGPVDGGADSRSDAQKLIDKTMTDPLDTPPAEVAGFRVTGARPIEEGRVVHIVYQRGDMTLSAFIMGRLRFPVPKDAFVKRGGVEYFATTWGEKSAVVVKTGNTHRVWVSDVPEGELVEAVIEVEKLRAKMQIVELRLIGGG